jgi:hypothetical protein
MPEIFNKIVFFLQQYEPTNIVFKKDMLKMEIANEKLEVYLFQLCRAEYLTKLNDDFYRVNKKVSTLTSISNIMIEGDEIEKNKPK